MLVEEIIRLENVLWFDDPSPDELLETLATEILTYEKQ